MTSSKHTEKCKYFDTVRVEKLFLTLHYHMFCLQNWIIYNFVQRECKLKLQYLKIINLSHYVISPVFNFARTLFNQSLLTRLEQKYELCCTSSQTQNQRMSLWNGVLPIACTHHSRLRQISTTFPVPETKPTQGWSVCFKDYKNVLHEILANRAWKGNASYNCQFCSNLANWQELRHTDQP